MYRARVTMALLLPLLAFGAGCRRDGQPTAAGPKGAEEAEESQESKDESGHLPPADVSHGEAPIGIAGVAEALLPVELPPLAAGTTHSIELDVRNAEVVIDKGVTYAAWTFGGTVPGPILHVRQGDTVNFTLTNRGTMPHSMDFHAAEIAPDKSYRNIDPGKSIHYTFVARVPGAFLYHCGTAPVAMHIANGMYGALIVDPPTPRPAARELVLVQSEFYTDKASGTGGAHQLDWDRMLSLAPENVVFNGRANQYSTHPIEVQANELVRIYVVNAGPNRTSAFHVVGGIFERVFVDSTLDDPLQGVQTVDVPVGGGAIFEVRLREPGDYPFVTHAFADATKGAVGVLRAVAPGQAGTATTPPSVPMTH